MFPEEKYYRMELEMLKIGNDLELFTEGVGSIYDMTESFKAMIDRIITKMVAYVKKLKKDIDVLADKRNAVKQIERLIKSMEKDPHLKFKMVEFADMSSAIAVYQKHIGKMKKQLRKILKKDYSKYNAKKEWKNLDAEIMNFEEELDIFEAEMDEALEKKIKLQGKEALRYAKNLASGRDAIYKYYFEMVHEFERFKIDATTQLRIKDASSTNSSMIFKKQTRCLTKLSAKMSKVTKKLAITSLAMML